MKLNKNQQRAVDIKGQNVLVFASAGGGKTTVLASRLLKRIVEDRISLDNIVALTFTNAAALNMKKRLEKLLKEAIGNHPEDTFLTSELSKISDANITTIHAFCLKLIKEYYYVINIPKTMTDNLLDDGSKDLLLNQAFNECIADFPDLMLLKKTLDPSLFNFDKLYNSVCDIIKAARNYPEPELWFNLIKSKRIADFDDLNPAVKKYYLNDLKAQIEIAIYYLNGMSALDTKHSVALAEKARLANRICKLNDYPSIVENLKELMTSIPNDSDEKYKQLRSKLKACFEDLASSLSDHRTLVKVHNEGLAVEKAMLDLAKAVYLRFQSIKFENATLDFDDFETYAYAILKANNGVIGDKLKVNIKEIMIDEFQDTNESQFALIKLFADNNLFLVGDVKQSIYRFRHAKPKIMQDLKYDSRYTKIHIRNNYRSNANIVAFNNELFGQIMNIYQNDVDDKDMQTTLPNQAIDNQTITFKVALGEDEKATRAKLLANTIHELHSAGTSFKDITVLVKTHDEKKPIKQALSAYNIPCFINDNQGYFTSMPIDVITAYFKYLLDEDDDFALVNILSSPLYGLSDADLLLSKKQWREYPAFNDDLAKLKVLANNGKLDEMIAYIININDFYATKLTKQEQANVDFLLNRLDSYKRYNIYDFVDYITTTKDFQKESASTISKDADVVQVMTIHTSKGLEFDTVILYSGHSNRFKQSMAPVCADTELGIGLSYINSKYQNVVTNIKKRSYLAKENIEDLLEYQRLLYVALTRPKKALYIIDALQDQEHLDELKYPLSLALIYARKGFTSLIYSAMRNNSAINFEVIESLDDLNPFKATKANKRGFEKKVYTELSYEDVSPSSLEKGRISLNLESQAAMDYGTKIHKIFELIDYTKPINKDSIKAIADDINDKTLDSIMDFVSHPIINEAKQGKIYQEFAFYLKDGDKLIHGFMDFVAVLDDKIILVDYKTDAVNKTDILIERYQEQIMAYRQVLEKIYQLPVKAFIYAINLKTFITF